MARTYRKTDNLERYAASLVLDLVRYEGFSLEDSATVVVKNIENIDGWRKDDGSFPKGRSSIIAAMMAGKYQRNDDQIIPRPVTKGNDPEAIGFDI